EVRQLLALDLLARRCTPAGDEVHHLRIAVELDEETDAVRSRSMSARCPTEGLQPAASRRASRTRSPLVPIATPSPSSAGRFGIGRLRAQPPAAGSTRKRDASGRLFRRPPNSAGESARARRRRPTPLRAHPFLPRYVHPRRQTRAIGRSPCAASRLPRRAVRVRQ